MARKSPEVQSTVVQIAYSSSSGSSSVSSETVETQRWFNSGSVKTPNWSTIRRMPRIKLPVNNYQSTLIRRYPGSYYTFNGTRSSVYWVDGSSNSSRSWSRGSGSSYGIGGAGPPYQVGQDITKVIAIANTKALLSLKDMKVNVLQVFGEAGQTVNLLSSTATRLARAFFRLRRFDVIGCASELGMTLTTAKRRKLIRMANKGRKQVVHLHDEKLAGFAFASRTWLEYVYGWRPLMEDVIGAVKTFADYQVERPPYVEVVGRHTSELRKEWYVKASGQTDVSIENVRAKVSYAYVVDNTAFRQMSSMGITDPALLVWELLPYSFVIDWFLPIGNWLSAKTADWGLTFTRGYSSTVVRSDSYRNVSYSKTDTSFGSNPSQSNVYVSEVSRSSSSRITQVVYTRLKLASALPVRFPSVKDPFNTSHLTSAIALLKQAFTPPSAIFRSGR